MQALHSKEYIGISNIIITKELLVLQCWRQAREKRGGGWGGGVSLHSFFKSV